MLPSKTAPGSGKEVVNVRNKREKSTLNNISGNTKGEPGSQPYNKTGDPKQEGNTKPPHTSRVEEQGEQPAWANAPPRLNQTRTKDGMSSHRDMREKQPKGKGETTATPNLCTGRRVENPRPKGQKPPQTHKRPWARRENPIQTTRPSKDN